MTISDAVRAGVEAAIERRTGLPAAIRQVAAVGGGCISPTSRIETDAGDTFFLKAGATGLPGGLLEAEAAGLRALADAGPVRVPEVIGTGGTDTGTGTGTDTSTDTDTGTGTGTDTDTGTGTDTSTGAGAWLLLEWLEPGRHDPSGWAALGRDLASLHRHRAGRFGADADNFIGSLPQGNSPSDDWAGFWRTMRLEPQLRSALDAGRLDDADRRRFDHLFRRLDDLLAPASDDGPSLLHGDLWNGNVHMTRHGPALIDPSVYHGHREVDLAMAELFGGFAAPFRTAYEDTWPLAPGYAPRRRAVYQLYYLLVHVNLFGAGYVGGTRKALSDAGV